MGIDDFILRKIAERLVLSLKKTFTVATGLKYQFWILITNVDNLENLDVEIKRVKAALDEAVADNFAEHRLETSVGVSIFPDPAASAKKLIEQAILAIQKAQQDGGKKVVVFGA